MGSKCISETQKKRSQLPTQLVHLTYENLDRELIELFLEGIKSITSKSFGMTMAKAFAFPSCDGVEQARLVPNYVVISTHVVT